MSKQRYGGNIASIVGVMGNSQARPTTPPQGGGLIGLSETVAGNMPSRAVTVNAVAPGFIGTAMTRGFPRVNAPKTLKTQIRWDGWGRWPISRLAVSFSRLGRGRVPGHVLHVGQDPPRQRRDVHVARPCGSRLD